MKRRRIRCYGTDIGGIGISITAVEKVYSKYVLRWIRGLVVNVSNLTDIEGPRWS